LPLREVLSAALGEPELGALLISETEIRQMRLGRRGEVTFDRAQNAPCAGAPELHLSAYKVCAEMASSMLMGLGAPPTYPAPLQWRSHELL